MSKSNGRSLRRQGRLREEAADPGFDRRVLLEVACSSGELTNREFRVLFALAQFGDRDGGNCFPKRQRLATAIDRSVASVDVVLGSLEQKGWISRVKLAHIEGRYTPLLYRFHLPKDGLHGALRWTRWTEE